jgi:Zn-dependent protease/CBS domain-containing protein
MNFLEFFKRQLLITYIYGIPVRIDYRWFFVVIVMSWLMAKPIPTSIVDDSLVRFGLGFATTIVFFVSILIHELAHSRVARSEGVEVREIVIHPFGGLARFRRAPDNPRAEFRIAIAGPIASFLLSLVFLVLMSVLAEVKVLSVLCSLLFILNLLLAVFNLFPGYPLDGGRVLRAFLWNRGYELNDATVLTGRCGQVIAVALAVFGLILTLLNGDFLTGLWMVLVGIFLFDAARGIISEVAELKLTRAGDVMTVPVLVEPETTIGRFVEKTLPMFRQTVFLVAQNKQFYGVLLLEDMKAVDRDDWHLTKIRQVMRPITPNYFVEVNTLIDEARSLMRENGIGAVGVIDENGSLVGFLQRGKIRRRN